MNIKNTIKKIWFSLYNSNRIVLLDYPIKPTGIYSKEKKHPHQKLLQLIIKYKVNYEQLLFSTLKYRDKFSAISKDKDVKDDTEPGWNNNYLPGLDIIMLYSLLAELNPKKYLEIGSGTSTKVAYKARKDNLLQYQITSIDPSPRKNIEGVADKIYKQEIQKSGTDLFNSLEENDIIFFDGTHTLYPNSDVMWFFLEILPILKKGVVVHIHDVYLPYDYPEFMLERYYNEQYLLGALLLSNPEKYEILCPNYFIYSDEALHSILDLVWKLETLKNVEQHGGSFWIKIRL